MEELLKQLGITKEGAMSQNGAYVIDLDTYDEYGHYYSLLEKNEDLEELKDSTQINIHSTDITYAIDNYTVTLLGDLDNEIYKIVITPLN